MEAVPSEERLEGISKNLENMQRLVAEEVHQRRVSDSFGGKLLAVDFDVLYGYIRAGLSPPGAGAAAVAMGEMLTDHEEIRFTMPPGAVHELVLFCSRLAEHSIISAEDQLTDLREVAQGLRPRPDLDADLRARLSGLVSGITTAKSITARLRVVLSLPNLTGLLGSGLNPEAIEPYPALVEQLFTLLQSARNRHRSQASMADSLNLAISLRAAQRGHFIPLVSTSRAVHRVYRLIHRRGGSRALDLRDCRLVISPETVLFSVGVRGASDARLHELSQSLAEATDKARSLGRLSGADDASKKEAWSWLKRCMLGFQEIRSTLQHAEAAGELAKTAWEAPRVGVPARVNLLEIANSMMVDVEGLRRDLRTVLSRANALFGTTNALYESEVAKVGSLKQLFPALNLLSATGSNLFIE